MANSSLSLLGCSLLVHNFLHPLFFLGLPHHIYLRDIL